MRNRIINGAMIISQRNGTSSVSLSGVANAYTLDRWLIRTDSDAVVSVQQSTVAPAGFNNSLLYTVTTADTSLGATQNYSIQQRIEGFNTADLGWGTANAKTVTLSFWVRSSLTGTFGGSIQNSAGDRSYPFTYTISAANTFEYKTVTIAGETTGTWVGATNGIGAIIYWSTGAGADRSGTAGSWAGSDFRSATGAVSVVGTSGATFYITGVQLEVGTQATSFEYRQYGTELALCQRYFERIQSGIVATTRASSSFMISGCLFSVQKRAAPTVGMVAPIRYVFPAVSFALANTVASAVSDTKGANIETDSSVAWSASDICRAGISDISQGGFYTFSSEL
jgi:hypothetical protein